MAKSQGEEFYINVTGGFVQIDRNSKVTVLADEAEHFFEINIDRAEQARKRAAAKLKEISASDQEYAKLAASLDKSLMRINIARKRAHRKAPITGEGVRLE